MDLEVGSVEEVVDNGSDTDVDVDDNGSPSSVPHLSSAQLLMQATQANHAKHLHLHTKPKGKLIAVSPHKAKHVIAKPVIPAKQPTLMTQSAKQASLMTQAAKQANLAAQTAKQASLMTQAVKQSQASSTTKTNVPPQSVKQVTATPQPKQAVTQQLAKTITPVTKPPVATPSPKQTLPTAPKPNLMAQSAKQANVIAQLTKQTLAKQGNVIQSRQVNVVKPPAQSPKSSAKQVAPTKVPTPKVPKQETQKVAQVAKSVTAVVPPPHKSPLIKQRPLQKQVEGVQAAVSFICFC